MGRHGKGVFGVVLLDEGTQLEIFSVEELDHIEHLLDEDFFPISCPLGVHPISLLPDFVQLMRRALVPVLAQQRVVDPVVWELSVHREVLGWARSAFGG